MGGKSERGWLDRLKERVDRWLEALEEALSPHPEPVPVPVKRPARR